MISGPCRVPKHDVRPAWHAADRAVSRPRSAARSRPCSSGCAACDARAAAEAHAQQPRAVGRRIDQQQRTRRQLRRAVRRPARSGLAAGPRRPYARASDGIDSSARRSPSEARPTSVDVRGGPPGASVSSCVVERERVAAEQSHADAVRVDRQRNAEPGATTRRDVDLALVERRAVGGQPHGHAHGVIGVVGDLDERASGRGRSGPCAPRAR